MRLTEVNDGKPRWRRGASRLARTALWPITLGPIHDSSILTVPILHGSVLTTVELNLERRIIATQISILLPTDWPVTFPRSHMPYKEKHWADVKDLDLHPSVQTPLKLHHLLR